MRWFVHRYNQPVLFPSLNVDVAVRVRKSLSEIDSKNQSAPLQGNLEVVQVRWWTERYIAESRSATGRELCAASERDQVFTESEPNASNRGFYDNFTLLGLLDRFARSLENPSCQASSYLLVAEPQWFGPLLGDDSDKHQFVIKQHGNS